jgi:hypothetical protein
MKVPKRIIPVGYWAGMKFFKKIHYHYQLVCSKVDTHPTLDIEPTLLRGSTAPRTCVVWHYLPSILQDFNASL